MDAMQQTRVTLLASLLGLSWLALSGGCGDIAVKADAQKGIEEAGDLANQAGKIKVCGDQTLAEVTKGDDLSDSCRKALESNLPEPQSNFESSLVVLGDVPDGKGGRTIYFIGGDREGDALFTDTPRAVSVQVTVNGKARVLAEGDFTVELPAEGDLLSLAVVNDYSASMREEDLDVVSEIETDLFTVLPPLYEAEVTLFSTLATTQQEFSENSEALLSAVGRDDNYERESTALYDGMGTALDSLVLRDRPLKVMLVSTDGAENASMSYEEAELISTIDDEKVVVIMLGALLADVPTLKRLSGDRGVYFYARGYGRLKTAVAGLIESLSHMAAIHLPKAVGDAEEVTLMVEGESVTID